MGLQFTVYTITLVQTSSQLERGTRETQGKLIPLPHCKGIELVQQKVLEVLVREVDNRI